MRETEMMWFEDVSPVNEPVLSFPVIGRLSMRQFVVLGTSLLASYAVFSSGHSPLAAIPACIGALLTFVRPSVGPAEWMAMAALLFVARSIARRGPRASGTKARSGMPGKKNPPPRPGTAPQKRSRTIFVSDPGRPILLRIRLEGGGRPVGCRSFKIMLGGASTESVFTDINGTVEAVIIPGTEGQKTITVEADGGTPVLSETVDVRASKVP